MTDKTIAAAERETYSVMEYKRAGRFVCWCTKIGYNKGKDGSGSGRGSTAASWRLTRPNCRPGRPTSRSTSVSPLPRHTLSTSLCGRLRVRQTVTCRPLPSAKRGISIRGVRSAGYQREKSEDGVVTVGHAMK